MELVTPIYRSYSNYAYILFLFLGGLYIYSLHLIIANVQASFLSLSDKRREKLEMSVFQLTNAPANYNCSVLSNFIL